MTDVTNQEFIVTGHVNDRFWGTGYSSYEYQGATYYTFGLAPYERWVDSDSDGWFDYGLRNESDGSWSRFEGFYWDNDATPPPRFDDGTRPEEPIPQNNSGQFYDPDSLANQLFASSVQPDEWIL